MDSDPTATSIMWRGVGGVAGLIMASQEDRVSRIDAATIAHRYWAITILLHRRHHRYRFGLPLCMDWLSKVPPERSDDIFKHHTRMSRAEFGKIYESSAESNELAY
jgi:hypothetical protein